VNHAEGGITLFDVIDDTAERAQVAHHFEGLSFFDHLLVDGIDVLGASGYFRLNTFARQNVLQVIHDLADHAFAVLPALGQVFCDLAVLVRVQIAES